MDLPSASLPPFPRPAGRSRWRYALILATVAIAALLAAAGGWRLARTEQSAANGPVIVIVAGSLRADHLPIYGRRGLNTPALEALASEGVVFERAYAHSPQTLPAHACILSGQLPFEHGVRGEAGFPLRPDVTLLPQLLKRRGYATGAVVSSFLLRRDTGIERGFDHFDDVNAANALLQRPGAESIALAQRWIASRSSPRFFLYLHLDDLRAPWDVPPVFAKYGRYDGGIALVDRQIGLFFDWLKGRGLYDRATIVFLSDHGEGLGDRGEQGHGLLLHDATLRVPLVVKLPRDLHHGRRVAGPVQQIDLAPTILDLLDAPRLSGLRGRSLRPLIEGRPVREGGAPIYAESFYGRDHFGWSGLRAITDGRFRFVLGPHPRLYDLQQDAGEQTNLALAQATTCERLRGTLESLVASDTPVPLPATMSENDRRRLGALGVVGGATPVADPARADPSDKATLVETYRQAWAQVAAGRFLEGAALYREVVTRQPGLIDAWLQLADADAAAGQSSEAADAYARALRIAPDNPRGLLGVSEMLLRLDRLDEARARALLAAGAQPADAHELLARIALARNDAPEATRHAQLASEADPTLPMPLFVQGVLLSRAGRYQAAAAPLQQAVEAAARRAAPVSGLHLALGETLARLDRYGDAEAQFKEELAGFPQNLQARVSLVMLYRAQRRDADVEQGVQDLLRSTPTAEGYAAAARLWTILGEIDRAAAARAVSRQRFGVRREK